MTPFDPNIPVTVGTPPAIVQRDTSRAEQVIEQAINLDRALSTNAFEMGDLFAEIIDGDYVHADHCEDLPMFLKKHNFELSPREIRYRAKISRASKKLGITRGQQLKAGISKMKAIFQLDPSLDYADPATGAVTNVGEIMKQLVEEAGAGRKLKEIRKQVDQVLGATGGEDSVLTWINLPTFTSRKEFVNETIDLAVQLSGDSVDPATGDAVDISRATAIERICADFRSDPNNTVDGSEEQGGEFEDSLYVRDSDGNDFETGM